MYKITDATTYFDVLAQTMNQLPYEMIERATAVLLHAYESNGTTFLFGNGGSAALASHFACDLGKGTINGSEKRFKALALTDSVPLMTAWANDVRYDEIFAQQLANFVQEDDVAFAISGSGNSPNVLRALEFARAANAITIGLSGFQGGKMKDLCDLCLIVPSDNMQIIEDLHVCVAHAMFTTIRRKLSQTTAAAA
jgi:D-sedoheptulose 7-phosphate isomerase